MVAPIAIPSGLVFNSRAFQLGYKQQMTPVSAGFTQTIDRVTPMWWAEYTTPPLNDARYSAAMAFFDALEGSINTFLAYDPQKIMPLAYINNPITDDPWTQTGFAAPRATALNYANSTITLDRLQNGAIISPGDYFAFYDSIAWFLYRARSSHVVAGNTATVTVSPRPLTWTGTQKDIVYRKATAEMKVIGGYKETASVGSPPVISFKAFQFINRTA